MSAVIPPATLTNRTPAMADSEYRTVRGIHHQEAAA